MSHYELNNSIWKSLCKQTCLIVVTKSLAFNAVTDPVPTIISEITWHELHNDHNRLFLDRNPDKPHDIWMLVLLEDSPFLQERPLLLVRQCHSACLDCYFLPGGPETSLVHITEVALKMVKSVG